jgi:hypothetical protein
VGTQVVAGEQRPARVAIGGVVVETTTEGGALAARAVDPATGTSVWTSPLTGSIEGAVLGPPVAYGDLVVVVGPRQPVPVCP